MGFNDQHYTLSVIDPRNGEEITSGVSAYIYGAGGKTLSTVYSNAIRTSLTNPITFTAFSDRLDFWSESTTHDIFLADDKGNVSFIPSVAPTDHILPLNRDGVDKCFVAPFVFNAGGSETDTGLDFPLNVKIYDAAVEVVTVDASATVDIGLLSSETNGDADGIAINVPTDNAAFLQLWGITETTTEDFTAAPYKGALMGIGTAGTSTANDTGNAGGPGHIVSGSNAVSLVYNPSASDTMAGYIYVWFKHLR